MGQKKIGAGIFAIDTQTGDVLLGQRSAESDNPKSWCPFGGTHEKKDGSVLSTAKREFSEESGSDTDYQISTNPIDVQHMPYVNFYTFVGLFDGKFKPHINKEHINWGWFPMDKLPSPLHPGFAEFINNKQTDINNIIQKYISTNNEVKAG